MEAKGVSLGLEELTHALEERDRKDSTREHSPLKKQMMQLKLTQPV
jgi:cytidylate kinase